MHLNKDNPCKFLHLYIFFKVAQYLIFAFNIIWIEEQCNTPIIIFEVKMLTFQIKHPVITPIHKTAEK